MTIDGGRPKHAGNRRIVAPGHSKHLSSQNDREQSGGMVITPGKCPICASSANVQESTERVLVVCPRCGSFALTSTARKSMPTPSEEEIPKISGWIRENQDTTIRVEHLPTLNALRMPSVAEKAQRILLRLARNFPTPGATFQLDSKAHLELQGVGWCGAGNELIFLIRNLLSMEMRFLSIENTGISTFYSIDPKGWAYLDSLSRVNPQSAIGFIAMWFDDSMNSAFVAIDQGIRAAGYTALRIDQKQHNNKIDDEIIAGIRRSKFLVADFTGHRGGVYFEAGFAKGLGLEVIWLCREDDLVKLHFDTRQYSHIPWQPGKLPELTKALKDRIEATIGHGPLS
jgi:hypothetical protein